MKKFYLLLTLFVPHLCMAEDSPPLPKNSSENQGYIDFNKNGRMDLYENPDADVESRIEDLLARMTLEEVIRVMEACHEAGQDVVRLHTGDPSLYGAIKEQMDRLDELSIPYQVCPGVSAFSGAAAALGLEYTLPGISQSVVITRMEGRTPVPEKEKVQSFAAHQSTMVLFLSTGLLGNLSQALVEGGYPPDTPAAIVYKATWPDEKKVLCQVSDLAETAEREGIKKTALIIVGKVLSGEAYQRSCLYDPAFTTEFRKGNGQAEDGK